ncbi:hypothetical protein S245_004236 [Arachis hypogaea]
MFDLVLYPNSLLLFNLIHPKKSILPVLFSFSLLVGCLLASPTCLHYVLPCFASSCYRPCPAFAALPRTVGLSMPCLMSSKETNKSSNN